MSDKQRLYEELLPLLDSPTRPDREGRVWSYCPVHGDGAKHKRGGRGLAGRSLSLHPTRGLTCFAGCEFTAILDALGARRGKTDAQASPVRRERPEPPKPGEWRVTATYDYVDPYEGTVVAHKRRLERYTGEWDEAGEAVVEKRFQWRLPTSTKWIGLEGKVAQEDMPLFGADAVVFDDDNRRVFWAEGEKARAAIAARGELAVCSGYGSTKTLWNPHVLEPLRGRHVIVWRDNDVRGAEFARHVKAQLRGIAKTCAVIVAPGPPKSDAHDFFEAGGDLEQLLADIVAEPTVDIVSTDRFVVKVPTEGKPIAFEFAQMTHTRTSLEADLTVSLGDGSEPYNQWINLKSQSTREGLRRVLELQFGKEVCNWTEAISIAYARVRRAYETVDRSVPLGEMATYDRPRWLVENLIPEFAPTVFFGRGSSLKSFMADAVILAVAMGADELLGMPVNAFGGVIVVDYEDPQSLAFRLRRLLLGMGLDPEILPGLPIRLWQPQGQPLATMTDGIIQAAEHMADQGTPCKLIVIDSAMMACGGRPEEAEPALAMFNALNRIGITSLIISHVSKGESEIGGLRSPYGNVAWENAPRRTYAFQRTTDVDADVINVGVMCQKSNIGKKPAPFAFTATFEGEAGPVVLDPANFDEVPDFEEHRAIGDRVYDLLVEAGTPVAIKDIAKQLDVLSDSVRKALKREEGQRFVMIPRGASSKIDRWEAIPQ